MIRIQAADLVADPRNWRLHPPGQRKFLREMVDRLGFVNPPIVRQLEDGRYMLVDGHLRASEVSGHEIDAVEVDLNEEEAAEAMATLDPLAGMAETSGRKLEALTAAFDSDIRRLMEDAGQMLRVIDRTPQGAAYGSSEGTEEDGAAMDDSDGAGEGEAAEGEEGAAGELVIVKIAVPKVHAREILRKFEGVLAPYLSHE